ncbi:OmpA family protein [Erythrobacter sp. F6033]|uniref:OmpA family protein n=1 Tax=Erythrobacter sp. F6033 TaxID=2926401 RepID=UPI001FF1618C|nr:OmpA family protein [Erythrobacter sp. F6033]MCK0129867.1 OmpA family protein [Erythrobacter sp. F6033]
MRITAPILALGLFAALGACSNQTNDAPADGDPAASEATPSVDAPVSILRPDVEQPELPAELLEPLNVTIGFPSGGDEIDIAASAALEEVLASEQVADGGLITLRAHSDAAGSDAVNLRASQLRGDAVRDWLIEKGVAEDRVKVIAFGEQNPTEPNAKPDGSANDAGRAANRRVEVEVSVIEPDGAEAQASSQPATID